MMLNCREVTERASDFLDAMLPWRVRLQMRLHMLMCRFCREYVRQMALVIRALKRLRQHEPPPQLNDDLLAMFRAQRTSGERG